MALQPKPDHVHVLCVVEIGLHHFPSAGMVEPRQELVRRVIATHDVACEHPARVLADVAGDPAHVAVKNSLARCAHDLVLGDDFRRVVHLDVDRTVGHGLHFVNESLDQLPGRGLSAEVGLNAQLVFLRRCRNCSQRKNGRANKVFCHFRHVILLVSTNASA